MQSYKGRIVELVMRVDVYKNLNQGGFSILCAKTRMVLAHADAVHISEFTFHVNEKARLKILERQCRSVHAWIRGTFVHADCDRPKTCEETIYYNPYVTSKFTTLNVGITPEHAAEIYCSEKLSYGSMHNKVDDHPLRNW